MVFSDRANAAPYQDKPGAAAERTVDYEAGKMDKNGHIDSHDIDHNATLTLHEKLDPNSKSKSADIAGKPDSQKGIYKDYQFVPGGQVYRVLRDWKVGPNSANALDMATHKAFRFDLTTFDTYAKPPVKTEYTFALVIIVNLGTAKGESAPKTPAELRLSWSADASEEYVWGYLSGFLEGKRVGCSFYADKIMPYTPHKPVSPEELPRQACLNALPDFTEPYFHKYVDAITSYYTKYPNDRQAGMPRILLELASPPGLTIDQVHEKLTR